MNFYFNYFASIGREQVNYTLYTIHLFACLFLKKLPPAINAARDAAMAAPRGVCMGVGYPIT